MEKSSSSLSNPKALDRSTEEPMDFACGSGVTDQSGGDTPGIPNSDSLGSQSHNPFPISQEGNFFESLSPRWEEYFRKSRSKTKRYQIIAHPVMVPMARKLCELCPDRFLFHASLWEKFPDGTDKIFIGGFQPVNRISGEHVLFLASFHNNDVTLSQFSVMCTLLQSFIESLTVVLPFYPVGTMERVVREGQVATASTYANMFSGLPSCGRPTRLIVYDLHTLQNRHYIHGQAIASLQSTIPILIERIMGGHIQCVVFPDDGAKKRFGGMFVDTGLAIITCGKTRHGEKRSVIIQDGDVNGKNVIIVDDLVQTGGTLHEAGLALKEAGAQSVSAFVAHAVFPKHSWTRFIRGGDRCCFERFYVSNSNPTVVSALPRDDVFEVLEIERKIIEDLDCYSHF